MPYGDDLLPAWHARAAIELYILSGEGDHTVLSPVARAGRVIRLACSLFRGKDLATLRYYSKRFGVPLIPDSDAEVKPDVG